MKLLLNLAALAAGAVACDSCYGPASNVEHVRHVKRIQPGAPEAKYGPRAPLEWGQINFMHTVGSPFLVASSCVDVLMFALLLSCYRPIPTAGYLVT